MGKLLRVEKPEVVEKMMQALKAGNHIGVSCDYAGVSQGVVSAWLRRGAREQTRADDEKLKMGWERPKYKRSEIPYLKFTQSVQQALAFAEARLATSVSRAAEENWVAAMTLLERRWPERWSRVQRSEISAPGGGPVQVDLGLRRRVMEEIEEDLEKKKLTEEEPHAIIEEEGEKESLRRSERPPDPGTYEHALPTPKSERETE